MKTARLPRSEIILLFIVSLILAFLLTDLFTVHAQSSKPACWEKSVEVSCPAVGIQWNIDLPLVIKSYLTPQIHLDSTGCPTISATVISSYNFFGQINVMVSGPPSMDNDYTKGIWLDNGTYYRFYEVYSLATIPYGDIAPILDHISDVYVNFVGGYNPDLVYHYVNRNDPIAICK